MRKQAETHYTNGSVWWTARMGGGKIRIEEVEIESRVAIEGEFSHFNVHTTKPPHLLRQIFHHGDLFKTREELCEHYIKQLKK